MPLKFVTRDELIKNYYLLKEERNSTMSLFEVAIIESPTPNDEDNGKPERLVFGPVPVIATNRETAIAAALAGVNIEWAPSRATVLVRPFV